MKKKKYVGTALQLPRLIRHEWGMSNLFGRWDLTVGSGHDAFPSWVELTPDGGRFVGRVGSARPLATIDVQEDRVSFSLPKQYESRDTDLVFQGECKDGRLEGTTTADDGTELKWAGVRAPELPAIAPKWGEPIHLVGENLDNWAPRSPGWDCHWLVKDGVLTNTAVGSDLVTKDEFFDFKLVAEYRYPSGSNSGIYLRGRYEFQIVDDYESGNSGVGNSGAIYGFISPTRNAVKPAMEWNRVEITFLGRFVTVVLNGETVIDNSEVPGITGGALDSREWEAGPIFLQGDHGPVEFRSLVLTPSE